MTQTRTTHPRAESEHELAQIAAMYLSGKSQFAIASEMGCTQQNISLRLKTIRRRWREATIRDFDELRSEQVAKIDRVELEYWDAWERSKKPRTRKGRKERSGDTNSDESSVVIEERDGNPAWLSGVERCIDRRCKLLGLDAPQKIAPTTPDGTQPYRPEPMTPEEAVSTYMEAIQRATANG